MTLKFSKRCPKCNDDIVYASKKALSNSIRSASVCKKCSSKSAIKHSEPHKCPQCGVIISFNNKSSEYRARSRNSKCRSCASSDSATKAWSDNAYRFKITTASNNQSESVKSKLSESTTRLWKDSEYRSKAIERTKLLWSNPEYRAKMGMIYSNIDHIARKSDISKQLWLDEEYRSKVIAAQKALVTDETRQRSRQAAIMQWKDDNFRKKMQVVIANLPKVSGIQSILYSILDDMGVKYFRERNDGMDDQECSIGPYHVDCLIPRVGKPPLIIEVNGTYWHSIRENAARDKAKLTYLTRLGYEVKVIWEHEFHESNRIIDLLGYWLGFGIDSVSYDFDKVVIGQAKASEYRDLLVKYHYLSTAGRGGTAWGAYLDSVLIAVAVISSPLRQNMDYDFEISRLCVHPKYRKKNLLSWMLSRILSNYRGKRVIAYSDSTFNHTGSVYKASGFCIDGEVAPDYWYSTLDGWVMHKKTLYNRAVNAKMKESEFAEKFGYTKIFGQSKTRFSRVLN